MSAKSKAEEPVAEDDDLEAPPATAEPADDELDDDVDDADEPPPSYPAPNPLHALGAALAMAVAVGAAFSSSLAFGKVAFALLAVVFGAAATWGILRSRIEGRGDSLRLRSGDLTLGAFSAGLCYALVLGGHPIVFPRGQARELFFLLAYVPLLDPLSDGRHVVAVGAGVICALEELALRSLLQPTLARRFGDFPGWALTLALDAVIWAPTLVLLADARAGWNPVYVGFAAAVSLVTGYFRLRTDRVAPSVITRMLLGWALIEFPVWAP